MTGFLVKQALIDIALSTPFLSSIMSTLLQLRFLKTSSELMFASSIDSTAVFALNAEPIGGSMRIDRISGNLVPLYCTSSSQVVHWLKRRNILGITSRDVHTGLSNIYGQKRIVSCIFTLDSSTFNIIPLFFDFTQ